MNNKFTVALVVVVAIIVTWVGVTYPKTPVEVSVDQVVNEVKTKLGALSGPDIYFPVSLNSGVVTGGEYATSTSGAQMPLLAPSIENISTIRATLNVQDATLTFPASSTIGFMRNPGDTRVYWVKNATTTAAMDITFAAGTGVNFKNATTTKILIGDTDGGNAARVTLIRQADTDIDMYLELFVDEQ